MHSKWQIWDFFTSFQKDYLASHEGILALNSFDPLCLKLMKDFLVRGAGDKKILYKMAHEVTKPWLEEEFQTLSLFGTAESFFIHQAQDLNADTLAFISGLSVTGRSLILSFESDNAVWKKVIKESKLETLMIEPPRFWEFNKLLDFVCNLVRLPLSFDGKAWMLESLENDLVTFYNSACLIKLNHPDAREVGLTEVKELLTLEKLDQFAMASLFARRKFKDFFSKLVLLEGDFDKMRAFFNFLQSHLVKMSDTSYLGQKSRLTQYDKDLESTSKLWKSTELLEAIERFNRWEIMSKKKESALWHEIKQSSFRSLYPLN